MFRTINILSWNIQGILGQIDDKKVSKINEIPNHIISKHNIIFLQETHLDDNKSDDIHLDGFYNKHYIRKRRGKARKDSGGLSIFIKEDIREHFKIIPNNNSDIVWLVTNSIDKKQTYIGSVYIPPSNSSYGKDHRDTIWENLLMDIENYSNSGNIILCGDFNSRTAMLLDYVNYDDIDKIQDHSYLNPNLTNFEVKRRLSMDKVATSNGRKLIESCIDNDLIILNGRTLGDFQGKYTYRTDR